MMSTTRQPFWPARWWWYGLLVLIACAAALRYVGYNFSLPYIDHVDEPAYNIAGRMFIDFGSAKPIGMHGYPPGIVTINYVLLKFFHDPSQPPGSIIYLVRLIGITFSVLTIPVMALLAYRVANPLAGWIAAGLWTFTPIIIDHSRYATADPFVTFFSVLAVFLVLSGTLYDRDKWCSWALMSAMLAVIFKYQSVAIVPVVLVFPLWRLVSGDRAPADRRRILVNFGSNLLLLAVFSCWLFVIFPITEAKDSPDWSASAERFGFPTLDIVRHNFFDVTLASLLSDFVWYGGLSGLAVWIALRFFRAQFAVPNLIGLAVLAASGLAWLIAVSFYNVQGFRQFIALGLFVMVICSAGLAGWAALLAAGLARLPSARVMQHSALISALLVIGVVVWQYRGNIEASVDNAHEHTLHDRRNDLAVYMDTSLAPGPYVSGEENHKTLNGPWGGYPGQHEFPLAEMMHDWSIDTLDGLVDNGVMYAIMSYYTYESLLASEQDQAFLDNWLLLKSYPPSDKYRGPDMVVFRLWDMQHTASGSVGPIQLVGYDIDRIKVAPGDTITFTLYWQVSGTPDADYTVYNHLIPIDSRDIVAQVDGPPLLDTRRPTTLWDDLGETLVSRPFTLTVDEGTPPGDYRLITGFYRQDNWQRLLGPDGDDFVLVTMITVE